MRVSVDDAQVVTRLVTLEDLQVRIILDRHFALMRSQSPEESCHVMDDAGLRASDAEIFGCFDGPDLLGIVALTHLSAEHGEIKSMHTLEQARGRGVGRRLLRHLISHARRAGIKQLSLETGSAPSFAAARALYASEDFAICPPFGSYIEDPLSVFMTRVL